MLRCTSLDDSSVFHKDDPVRYLPCEAHLVGDNHHRDVLFLRELHHDIEYVLNRFRIQRTGRLIEQDDRGLAAERPRDRDSLLLSTGQGGRINTGLITESDDIEIVIRGFLGLRLRNTMELRRCQGQVPEYGEMRVEIKLLEHHRDLLPYDLPLILLGHLLPIDQDATAGRCFQEVHAADGGGLTGSGWADDNQLLSVLNFEVHVL